MAPICCCIPRGAGLDFPATVTVKTQPELDCGHGHEAGPGAGVIPGAQLSRPGGHALFCGPHGLRQHAGGRPLDSAGYLSRGSPAGQPAQPALGTNRQDDSSRVGGVSGDALEQLQHHDDLRSEVRGRQCPGAPELPCRDLQSGTDRESRCSLRSPRTRSSTPGTSSAFGRRRWCRTTITRPSRLPGSGSARGSPTITPTSPWFAAASSTPPSLCPDGEQGEHRRHGSAHRPGRRIPVHLDPSGRRQWIHLLPEGLSRRAVAGYS